MSASGGLVRLRRVGQIGTFFNWLIGVSSNVARFQSSDFLFVFFTCILFGTIFSKNDCDFYFLIKKETIIDTPAAARQMMAKRSPTCV